MCNGNRSSLSWRKPSILHIFLTWSCHCSCFGSQECTAHAPLPFQYCNSRKEFCLLLYILCVGVGVCVCVFPTVEVVGIVCIQVYRYLFLVEVHQSLLELHFTSWACPVPQDFKLLAQSQLLWPWPTYWNYVLNFNPATSSTSLVLVQRVPLFQYWHQLLCSVLVWYLCCSVRTWRCLGSRRNCVQTKCVLPYANLLSLHLVTFLIFLFLYYLLCTPWSCASSQNKHILLFISAHWMNNCPHMAIYLTAGHMQSMQPADPKVFCVSWSVHPHSITCAVISLCTLLPCNFTEVDFGQLQLLWVLV